MSLRNPALDAVGDPLVGTIVGGKYTIRKLIGRGGVGLVYLATQTTDAETDRDVVIKVLAPHWAKDTETMARFQREASRLSTLRHPNIVRMFDHGREASRAFLVMEYCNGELLSDYVERNRALTLEQFVPIAAQLLKGIGHCHSRGMMVRDIKPANVMLVERKGRANFVKVLDFGLAKLLKDDQPVTEEHVIGTVGYLSPEQIKGEDVDLRVDVYAVGVLFYFMLSGRLPFDGETNATVFYKTINERPPELSEVIDEASDMPKGLLELIHRCLEKKADDRPRDADEIVELLIDVVPAALFRLPRADTARTGVASNIVPPGHGNTGMMQLLGTDKSPSGPVPEVDPAALSTEAAVLEESGATEAVPPTMGTQNVEAVPLEPGLSSRNKAIGAGAAMLAGALVAVWLLGSSDDPPAPEPAKPVAVAKPSAEPGAVAKALDQAEASLNGNALEDAEAQLDAVSMAGTATPAEHGRLNKLERRLKLTRLMQTGTRFESEGNVRAAIGVFTDALALDPNFVPAREAIARLEGGDAPPTEVERARAAIDSTPAAVLHVDGKRVGKTPFTGELSVGKHAIELHARGYTTWSGTIDVQTSGTKPVAVALHKRTGRGPSPRPPVPAAEPKPDTTPAPPPEATKAPEPKPDPKPSNSPFLPTKDKGKNSVFLPTKD